MNRKAARTLAKTTLTALGSFQAVLHGAPDSFGGQSPVALITSRSLELTEIARDLYTVTNGITVSIYVVRAAASGEATEDTLDDLVAAAAAALHSTGVFVVGQSDAGTAGTPSRLIDGKIYRLERIPLTILDEGEG